LVVLVNDQPGMTLFAKLIAQREGFGKPGNLPTRRNNPGDLRHAPHGSHAGIGPNDIAIEDSAADGWADEERQLRLYAERGFTVRQAVYEWAPPPENDSAAYLEFILSGFGGRVDADTPLSLALEIPA
jgi:hypothetical protein